MHILFPSLLICATAKRTNCSTRQTRRSRQSRCGELRFGSCLALCIDERPHSNAKRERSQRKLHDAYAASDAEEVYVMPFLIFVYTLIANVIRRPQETTRSSRSATKRNAVKVESEHEYLYSSVSADMSLYSLSVDRTLHSDPEDADLPATRRKASASRSPTKRKAVIVKDDVESDGEPVASEEDSGEMFVILARYSCFIVHLVCPDARDRPSCPASSNHPRKVNSLRMQAVPLPSAVILLSRNQWRACAVMLLACLTS